MRTLLCIACLSLIVLASACNTDRQAVDPSGSAHPAVEAMEARIVELEAENTALEDSLRQMRRRLQADATGAAAGDEDASLQERVELLERRQAEWRKLKPLLMDNRVGVWGPDEQGMHLQFVDPVPDASLAKMLEAFNERNPSPQYPGLALEKVDDAAAFLRVLDGEQLAEAMGTTGSWLYMGAATYSLTSLAGIDSVYFDFEEGSHARPGFYQRADWLTFIEE